MMRDMSADVEALLAQIFADPHRETKDDAAKLGHTARCLKPKRNHGLARWDCSCGMYGTASTRAAAYDELIAHLRQVVVEAKLTEVVRHG